MGNFEVSGERREDIRAVAGFSAQVVAIDKVPVSHHPVRGVLENVGGGGIALGSGTAFPEGAQLTVVYKLPGDEQLTEVVVEVVASERLITRETISHSRFVTIAPVAMRAIYDWTAARGRALV